MDSSSVLHPDGTVVTTETVRHNLLPCVSTACIAKAPPLAL